VQIALWIVLCLGSAILLHSRPALMVCTALAIWTFVPGIAAPLITGKSTGLVAFHPATWFVLACMFVLLVRHPRDLLTEIAGRWVLYLTQIFVVAAAVVMTMMGSRPPGLVIIVDQVLVPVIMFWIASAAFRGDPANRLTVRNWVVGLAAAQSAISLVQWVSGSVLVYGAQFRTNYWFTPAWTRWMGTTDHPLVLSMLLCAAVPLVAGLRRPVIQICLLALMSAATLITQSRTAAVLMPVCLLYVVFRSRARPGAKMAMGAAIAVGAIALLMSPLTAGITARLRDDTGSTKARSLALDFFFGHWQQFLYQGDGITTSYLVARLGGLSTSLENAFLIYAVGVGIIVAVAYFGSQVAVVLASLRRPRLRGALLAAVMVLVIPQTFSSLGVDTVCGPLLWVILSLVASGSIVPAGSAAPEAPSEATAGQDKNRPGSRRAGLSPSTMSS